MAYYRYYIDIINGGSQGRFEILYYLLNVCIASFNLDAAWLFAAIAIIFLLPLYVRIINESPYPTLSVFLLVGMTYYFYFLNGTRQMLAASCLFLSIPFIVQRRFVPFIAIVCIATGFHYIAIIFAGLYFLARLNFGVKLLTGITILVFFFPIYWYYWKSNSC